MVSVALPNYCNPVANISSGNWTYSAASQSKVMDLSLFRVSFETLSSAVVQGMFCANGSHLVDLRIIEWTGCSFYFLHWHSLCNATHDVCYTFPLLCEQAGADVDALILCTAAQHKDNYQHQSGLLSCYQGLLGRDKGSFMVHTHPSLPCFNFTWLTISGSDISACGCLWSTLEKQSYFLIFKWLI